jgi:hypothetical protein
MAMRLFSKDTSLHEIAIFGQQVIERTNFYCEQNRAILRPLLNNLLRCESGFADPSAWDDADLSDPEPESPPQPVDYLSREEQAELKNLERAVVRNQHLLYVAALRHKVAEQHIELARQEAMPPPSPPQPTHEPPRIEPAPPEPQSPEPPAPHVAAGEDLAVPPAETSPDDDEFMVLFGRSPVAADDDSTPNTPARSSRRSQPQRAVLRALRPLARPHSARRARHRRARRASPRRARHRRAPPSPPTPSPPSHAPVEPATVEPTHVEPTPVEPATAEPSPRRASPHRAHPRRAHTHRRPRSLPSRRAARVSSRRPRRSRRARPAPARSCAPLRGRPRRTDPSNPRQPQS